MTSANHPKSARSLNYFPATLKNGIVPIKLD